MYPNSIIPPNIDYGKISAEPFSDKKPYVVGELCIQFNKLWKFKSPKDAGAWDESKVEETTISKELEEIISIQGVSQEDFWELTNGTTALFNRVRQNKLVQFCVVITLTESITTNGVIGTLKPQYVPTENYVILPVRTGSDYKEVGTIWFYKDGTIRLYGNISKGTSFYVQGLYMIA